MFGNYSERINKNRHLSTRQNAYFCLILTSTKLLNCHQKLKKISRRIFFDKKKNVVKFTAVLHSSYPTPRNELNLKFNFVISGQMTLLIHYKYFAIAYFPHFICLPQKQ
jgi:hypothetical protein